ncbi:hypothetical protein HY414_02705 [Candidatus Kaiserbacteria bacterium]|nr:hypothetical protein [Candidatus Kaiserbacteria bacterium]
MQPHVLRLFAFVAAAGFFGAALWFVNIGNANPRALVALTMESAPAALPSSGSPVEDKGKCTVERVENGKKVRYGKICRPTYQSGKFDPECSPYRPIKAGTCEVIWCTTDGKKCTRATQTAEPSKRNLPKTEKELQALKNELGGSKIMAGNDIGLVPQTNLAESEGINQAFDSSFESSFDRAAKILADDQGLTPEQLAKGQGFNNYEDYKKYWLAEPRMRALQDDFAAIETNLNEKGLAFVSREQANLLQPSQFDYDPSAKRLASGLPPPRSPGGGDWEVSSQDTRFRTGNRFKPSDVVQTKTQGGGAWGGIRDIAGGVNQGGNTGGSHPNSSGSRGAQQTFKASPILGTIANWAFGNGGGGGGTGGGYSGGTVAYVQQGDVGYYNRDFETAETQITFPDSQPTPEQILAYLEKSTQRKRADPVTAEELTDRGVVENVVLQAVNNVVTPVGQFIQSFFSSEEVGVPEGREVAEAAREERPPLERGRLVLTLSADDSLVAGDPSSLATPERPTYEAFESIPESNRAWVQSAPRAGEGIDSLAGEPPTYGWSDSTESEGEEAQSAGGVPEVSDAPFEPFFPRFGFEENVEEGETAEPPRSFFSVMGKSFETIGDAVSSLFSNIGVSLFWWL